MSSDTPESWRPDAPFLLRIGPLVFGVGVLVTLVAQLGAGELRLLDLVLNGFAGVLIFLGICGAIVLGLHRIHNLTGLRKATALAAIFFIAGAFSWLMVQAALAALGRGPFPGRSQIAFGIGLSGLFAILLGTGFYLYEAMRQRAVESASRLKDAEIAEKELALARSIQERLLPPTELSGEGYRIAARHLPARFVAGDFFDVFSLPDGALGLVVADVAGRESAPAWSWPRSRPCCPCWPPAARSRRL